ncbi:MAG: methionyl-tRNA formyltransferase [bacterium]|nr:methionyl-tRNA formyltransferase [bacterium]
MTKKPKIAFFGTPYRAVIVLETLKQANLSPTFIVTQPDRSVGRKLVKTASPVKIWAEKEKIPVLQPENLEDRVFLETLKKGDFDVFVVVAYGKILKQKILDIPKRGVLNLHASLLPRLRGSSPIETAVLTDEKKTGVSIILLDALMDHGPIVSEREINVPNWPVSAEKLSSILCKAGGELLAETIPLWLSDKIKVREQDHEKATYTKKIKKEDGLIDFSASSYVNYLKFLAYREWPTSYFFTEKAGRKMRVIVTDATFEKGSFIIRKVIPEGRKEISFEEFRKNYKFTFSAATANPSTYFSKPNPSV